MKIKRYLILLIFIMSISLFAQKKEPYNFGEISPNDYDLKLYSKDSTANAVFLYERGKTTFHTESGRIFIKTKYYAKIKIFNKKGFDIANIEIPLYNNKQTSEKVEKIKGITHNGKLKNHLSKSNIFKKKINDNWSEVSFTMPNIKEQSIIEYEYTLKSPFLFNFKGWEFQTEIPKLYSEFYALVPGNYIYNRRLIGSQNLSKNESKVKRRCFSIPGISKEADCEELLYAMEYVPSFIEEDYMTSKKNYLSAIQFELSEFRGFNGVNEKYTKTWKSVDNEFKGEKSIGRQLRKVDYFEKNLPQELTTGTPTVKKAITIYNYIKNHFTWNGKYRVFKDVNVKDAFKDKTGNSMEINIALINALNAAGFDTELMLISTRKNGYPTKKHPVMNDFNYGIAKLNIDKKSYLLDATDKLLPFNMLPFKALNGYGRVMNFKKGSYWYDIVPKVRTSSRINLDLILNDEGNFEGKMNIATNGYKALNRRKKFLNKGEEEYLNDLENERQDLSVISYHKKFIDDYEKPFKEVFDIEIETNLTNKTILLNPFIINKITKNPFKLVERSYPVNFGYPIYSLYTLRLKVPQDYVVKSLPKDVAIKLPENSGIFTFKVEHNENIITILSTLSIRYATFTPSGYYYLKEFFNQIIKTHQSFITLEKK